jgi:acetyl-CoA acetyltransferase
MSNIPYYLTKARYGYKYGNGEVFDGLTFDGLTDVYNRCAMGVCADNTAKEMNISRQARIRMLLTRTNARQPHGQRESLKMKLFLLKSPAAKEK